MARAGPGRIAVLGAGIMGCCTAMLLARSGWKVTLFDKAPAPMSGASRWNEGKIHLGHLYSADLSRQSANAMISGGLAFRPILEDLLGQSIAPAIAERPDCYLIHRNSVVSPEAVEAHFAHLDAILADRDTSGYLNPLRPAARLSSARAEAYSAGSAQVGFRVSECSVNTQWIADRLVSATLSEPGVTFLPDTSVDAVISQGADRTGPWTIRSGTQDHGGFDRVVNALWQARIALDRSLGIDVDSDWSHRYRVSLFARTRIPVNCPSAVLAVGPFGDVKNYDQRHFYMSWYPAGLVGESRDVTPPEFGAADIAEHTRVPAMTDALRRNMPFVAPIFDALEDLKLEGGWVYAQGHGSLARASSTIHRRDRFGISSHGSYISVDTGKYSTAPWLARGIVDLIISG